MILRKKPRSDSEDKLVSKTKRAAIKAALFNSSFNSLLR
jgi:hypothetical protein